MNKFEALEDIKEAWSANIPLGEKIIRISTDFYSSGLNLTNTASYIKATPTELDALLGLSEFDDDIIEMISEVDPPKTTWTIFSNASDDEVREALLALKNEKKSSESKDNDFTYSEFVYKKMLEVSGPTIESKVAALSGNDIKHALKKGEDYSVLSAWETKFMKSIPSFKRRGKTLSEKQVNQLVRILNMLADAKIITRDSIDGDQDICDRILDALER